MSTLKKSKMRAKYENQRMKRNSLNGVRLQQNIVNVVLIMFVLFSISIDSTAQGIGLHVDENHRVLFGGDTTGAGTKLMWIPSKRSFLAGYIDSSQWDIDSVGFFSAVFGYNNQNRGDYNILGGFHNTIRDFSDYSITGGRYNTIGLFADYANVGGAFNMIGDRTSHSTIAGESNYIGGNVAFANVDGFVNKALSSFEHIIGRFADTTVTTTPSVWQATQQLFAIGNGTNENDRNNALTVLKNGNFGINESMPQSDLHIKQSTSDNSIRGIRLESEDDSDFWTTYIDSADDYNFGFNGDLRAFIQDGSGSFVITSDRRLKKSINSFDNVLDRVMKLKPSKYYYKNVVNQDRKSWGFIAQEVEKYFPDIVHEKDGYKGLAYDDFAILSIKAIQEQQSIIETQQSQISHHSKENRQLKGRIEKLEALVSSIVKKEE